MISLPTPEKDRVFDVDCADVDNAGAGERVVFAKSADGDETVAEACTLGLTTCDSDGLKRVGPDTGDSLPEHAVNAIATAATRTLGIVKLPRLDFRSPAPAERYIF